MAPSPMTRKFSLRGAVPAATRVVKVGAWDSAHSKNNVVITSKFTVPGHPSGNSERRSPFLGWSSRRWTAGAALVPTRENRARTHAIRRSSISSRSPSSRSSVEWPISTSSSSGCSCSSPRTSPTPTRRRAPPASRLGIRFAGPAAAGLAAQRPPRSPPRRRGAGACLASQRPPRLRAP